MRKTTSQGFILLEAIIGILIFSLAILGIIGFQAASSKLTADARYQTEAAMLADELIARMNVSSPDTIDTDFAGSGANNKFKDWLDNRVKGDAGLPAGTASISIDKNVTTGTVVNLTLQWTAPGEAISASEPYSGQYKTSAVIYR
ncbi:MAG: hypothetical protein QM803_11180 [Rhodocyclaceae bacterium]